MLPVRWFLSHLCSRRTRYELCDEHGLYVVDEANIESHPLALSEDTQIGDTMEFLPVLPRNPESTLRAWVLCVGWWADVQCFRRRAGPSRPAAGNGGEGQKPLVRCLAWILQRRGGWGRSKNWGEGTRRENRETAKREWPPVVPHCCCYLPTDVVGRTVESRTESRDEDGERKGGERREARGEEKSVQNFELRLVPCIILDRAAV